MIAFISTDHMKQEASEFFAVARDRLRGEPLPQIVDGIRKRLAWREDHLFILPPAGPLHPGVADRNRPGAFLSLNENELIPMMLSERVRGDVLEHRPACEGVTIFAEHEPDAPFESIEVISVDFIESTLRGARRPRSFHARSHSALGRAARFKGFQACRERSVYQGRERCSILHRSSADHLADQKCIAVKRVVRACPLQRPLPSKAQLRILDQFLLGLPPLVARCGRSRRRFLRW